jgi:hypothetical protein
MGDVGGEALDGVHPLAERVGHVLEAASEVADLVVALGQVGREMARARAWRTRSAARASRSTGWATRLFSSSEEASVTRRR